MFTLPNYCKWAHDWVPYAMVVVYVVLLMSVFSHPAAAAIRVSIDLAESGSTTTTDTIVVGRPYEFQISLENDYIVSGIQLGLETYSPSGATWTWNSQPDGYGPSGPGSGGQYLTVVPGCRMDPTDFIWDFMELFVTEINIDGVSPDTLFPGGIAMDNGLPTGPLEHMMSIHFTADSPASDGVAGIICIDSAFIPPSGPFFFSNMLGDNETPQIDGPFCYPVVYYCPHDSDGDGYGDPGYPENDCPDDNCPDVYNPDQADTDGDGTGDVCDNCPSDYNFDQFDADEDSLGDVCDDCTDTDDDGFGDPGYPNPGCETDNCPDTPNADQFDDDSDDVGDVCDNCPTTPNNNQQNSDSDSYGDACDNCPGISNENQANSDNDTHGDLCDNCPDDDNENQADADGDGIGDVCDIYITVTTTNDAGIGSLRQAIVLANSSPGTDTIEFAVSGIITILTPLPALTDDSTAIMGTWAPGGINSVTIDASSIGSGDGLLITGSGNFVEGIVVFGAPGNGVAVQGSSAVRNTIAGNLFYDNGGLAIDLGADGVTTNDAGDGDIGPNDLLNYPEIDSITSEPDQSYTIYGRAAAEAAVEFFVAHPADDSTRPADSSGYGEAWSYVGQTISSPTGEFSYNDSETEHFSLITCTATDPSGNTSEMSENFTLHPKPLIVVTYVYTPSKGANLPQNGVNIIVEDPTGAQFGRDSLNNPITDIADGEYYEDPNDSVVIPNPVEGEYDVIIVGEAGSATGTCYSTIIKTDGLENCILVMGAETPMSGTYDSHGYTYDETWEYDYMYGDASGDGICNISDAVYVINYIFKGGPTPEPEASGDANCDTSVSIADAVYVVNYVFKGGPAPCVWE